MFHAAIWHATQETAHSVQPAGLGLRDATPHAQVVKTILAGEGFGFTLPSRTNSLKYIDQLDTIFLE
jgi:hypothetical protein